MVVLYFSNNQTTATTAVFIELKPHNTCNLRQHIPDFISHIATFFSDATSFPLRHEVFLCFCLCLSQRQYTHPMRRELPAGKFLPLYQRYQRFFRFPNLCPQRILCETYPQNKEKDEPYNPHQETTDRWFRSLQDWWRFPHTILQASPQADHSSFRMERTTRHAEGKKLLLLDREKPTSLHHNEF